MAAAQLARLTEEMNEILPQLGRETTVHFEPQVPREALGIDSTALDNSLYELPKAAE